MVKKTFVIIVSCLMVISCSHRSFVNLTPDIISGYGLDQTNIAGVQFYYKSLSIHADSSTTADEPTVFSSISPQRKIVTEDSSPAALQNLSTGDIITLKDNTPCKVTNVLDNGKVLRVDFGTIRLDFKLSYRTGYAFELITDTLIYNGQTFIRSRVPLVENIGLLCVDRKKLSAKEIKVPGKTIEE